MSFLARRWRLIKEPIASVSSWKAYCVVSKEPPSSIEGGSSSPDGSSAAESNSLRADVSLPPLTFGSKRWEEEYWDSDVPANEPRRDLNDEPVDPEAVSRGLAYVMARCCRGLIVWKAFGIATVIVFGGASLVLGLVATKLNIHSRDDIRVKGRDLIQQKMDMVREHLMPLNKQADDLSQRWRGAEVAEQNPMVKEVSQALGPKAS